MICERANGDHVVDAPCAWVCRWRMLIPAGGRVLDVATGSGRHARYLAGFGHPIDAIDRDADALKALRGVPGISALRFDLEADPWPYAPRSFAGVVVTNYLHRPLFPHLIDALAPGGVLIYDTFAVGNEKYGRPRRPDFLLRPCELLEVACRRLEVVAYDSLILNEPRLAVRQRLCAVNTGS